MRATDVDEHSGGGFCGGPQEEASSGDGRSFAVLRRLLVGPEQRDIRTLYERLENPELRAQEISAVLAEAIQLRHSQGGSQALIEALTPSIVGSLTESARKHPGILSEALFPVVGPAVRRSIAQYIRSMTESFNRALEYSLSIRGIRWRMEAIRTGKKFAEVVVLHSLVYRVEQVFLIHAGTSLILHHEVAPRVDALDPALVSGMLSAIQDFVRDSFSVPRDEPIESMRLGELEVWVEQGPQAILATAIRGHAPEALRLTFREALEKVHGRFGSALEGFDGDSSVFEGVREDLALCFNSRYHENTQGAPKPYFSIALLLLLAAAGIWMWAGFRRQRHWSLFVNKLRAQPGIAVTSFTKEKSQYQISGLRDPLAVEPRSLLEGTGLDAGRVQFRWAPYYSLDDAIVLKRIAMVLQPPPTVTLSVRSGNLRVQGKASAAWIEALKRRAIMLPGFQELDMSGLQDQERVEFERHKHAIESAALLFEVNRAELDAEQQTNFEKLVKEIKATLADGPTAVGQDLVIEVIGHSDNTGAEAWNLLLSKRRADMVARRLIRNEIKPRSLLVRGIGYSSSLQVAAMGNDTTYHRSVTFRVHVSKAPRK